MNDQRDTPNLEPETLGSRHAERPAWHARGILSPNRRGHGLQILLAVVVLFLSALFVDRGSVTDWEVSVFRSINDLPAFLEPPIALVMQLGNYLVVPFVAAVALILRRYRLAFDFAFAGTVAWLFAKLIKSSIERGRPVELLADVVVRGDPATGYGYISGHAAVAASLAAVISPYVSRRTQVILWALAFVVGFARIYVGVHLPLDVVGGTAVGWAVGSLVHFLLGPPDRAVERADVLSTNTDKG
jgi:membrane-associated phospholipid phosphatase